MIVSEEKIRSDLDICFKDLPVEITYRSKVGESVVNKDTGVVTENYNDITELTAIKHTYTAEEILKSNGYLQFGDTAYYIKKHELVFDEDEVEPKVDDQIVIGALKIGVFGFELDTSDMLYRVDAREI